ncbi:MAG: PEGA domain-containing protein, partial [bacterium]
MKRKLVSGLALLLLIILIQHSSAQVLGEMTFEEVDPMGAIPDDPSVSLLIVESSVPHLGFSSRKGIRTVIEKSASLYYVVLDPGVDYVTIAADGYLPLELGRVNFPIKTAKKIKVTPLRMAEGEGTLVISSTPTGASIMLNDVELRETTPATLPNQKSGGYRVRLSGISGYANRDTTVMVRKGEKTTVTMMLPKLIAGLTVTSTPLGAKVFWNGIELGRTPLIRSDLEPGEGMLTVVMEDYAPVNLPLVLKSGETQQHEIPLIREKGSVEVTTLAGAEVLLDGESNGVANASGKLLLKDILTGNYTVTARLANHKEASSSVTVTADRTAGVTITPEPLPGAIAVTASRMGAMVVLDGKATNVKTPGRLEGVPAGTHRVAVQLAGYTAEGQAVTVSPESTATVNFELTATSSSTASSFTLPEGLLEENYIEPTLAEIARLEKAINDTKRGLEAKIEREVQLLRQTDTDFAARDPFETDAEYEERSKHASRKEADLRNKMSHEVAVNEKLQLESLKQRRFITRDVELELDVEDYDANRGEWTFVMKRDDRSVRRVLAIGSEQARKMYQNRATLRVYGELAIVDGKTSLEAVVIDESVS